MQNLRTINTNTQVHRQRQGKNNDSKIKNKIREFVEGKTVTLIMAFVTIFALVGDDIRVFGFGKDSDELFFGAMTISMFMFATEIWINTIVIDEFKYSFFFWLDIIATLSLVIDIPWFTNIIRLALVDYPPNYKSVNAVPGVGGNASSQGNILQLVKSLRLIRLIRIIKLYKIYLHWKEQQTIDTKINKKKKKKNQVKIENKEEEVEESEFKKETDPTKLGKALEESINKKTIVGLLFMLMFLPLLSPPKNDFSANFTLREVFWFGISSCRDPTGFYCNPNNEKRQIYLTKIGWQEMLRGFTKSGEDKHLNMKKKLLWLYIPNWENDGTMESIKSIPNKNDMAYKEKFRNFECLQNKIVVKKGKGKTQKQCDDLCFKDDSCQEFGFKKADGECELYLEECKKGKPKPGFIIYEKGMFWEETTACAGFIVHDTCPWRYEEMQLVSYTPKECIDDVNLACDQLTAFARYENQPEK